MDEKEFEKKLTEHLDNKFQECYNKGLYDGWRACCAALYHQTKHMTSAKAIIAFLKMEKENAEQITGANKSEPTL